MKIGVFDSGLGGLTAVKELFRIAPGADIVYLGDTGRVPYGSKSKETITRYAEEAVARLQSDGVEAIVVACGTVSSVALPSLRCDVPIFGVVEAASKKAAECSRSGRIGVIATSATIKSGAYESAIAKFNSGAEVVSRACPLFVPLVENGRASPTDPIVRAVIEDHLRELRVAQVDTLLLGCTHYPILREAIAAYMGESVTLVDSGREVAALCVQELGLLRVSSRRADNLVCFVTDSVDDFQKNASVFLGEREITDVRKISLW